MLKEELVNENSRDEPVCLMFSEGLAVVDVGARLSVLKGELVNENSRDEPVCLMFSGGLVVVNVGARPSVLKGELVRAAGLAFINRRSSSACVQGRARQ